MGKIDLNQDVCIQINKLQNYIKDFNKKIEDEKYEKLADQVYNVVICNMDKSPSKVDKKCIEDSLKKFNDSKKKKRRPVIEKCLDCKKFNSEDSKCTGPKKSKGSHNRERYFCNDFIKK